MSCIIFWSIEMNISSHFTTIYWRSLKTLLHRMFVEYKTNFAASESYVYRCLQKIQSANITVIYMCIYNTDPKLQLKYIYFFTSMFHTVRSELQMNTFQVDQSFGVSVISILLQLVSTVSYRAVLYYAINITDVIITGATF